MNRPTNSVASITGSSRHLSTLPLATLSFPDVHIGTRDAHKLRGYFGNLFREHSPLLHNHFEDGQYRYAYPLVQYKVLQSMPMLLGIGEGADLLAELFLKTKELNIDKKLYPINFKDFKHRQTSIGMVDSMGHYQFETLWMPLNQKNHQFYKKQNAGSDSIQLEKILTGNILSFYKAFDHIFGQDERVKVKLDIEGNRRATFKNQPMTVFWGQFSANVLLPDFIGLGRSVSRGFGVIRKIS